MQQRDSCLRSNDSSLLRANIPRRGWKRWKGCVFSPPFLCPVPARGRGARKSNLSIAFQPISLEGPSVFADLHFQIAFCTILFNFLNDLHRETHATYMWGIANILRSCPKTLLNRWTIPIKSQARWQADYRKSIMSYDWEKRAMTYAFSSKRIFLSQWPENHFHMKMFMLSVIWISHEAFKIKGIHCCHARTAHRVTLLAYLSLYH